MPALAMTDLANMFGMVKFYQEARGKGSSPSSAAMSGSQRRPIATSLRACCCCVKLAPAICKLCELLTRAYRTNQHRGRAEIAARLVRRDRHRTG